MVQTVGLRSYYWSQNLNTPQKFVDFYGRDPMIDRLLVNKYDFCATGMTHLGDGIDWELRTLELSEAVAYSDFSLFRPLEITPTAEALNPAEQEADELREMVQTCIKGFS